jgi:hypothetical protein
VETSLVCWAHLGPIRIPPVELGVDQGRDVDTVDRDIVDFAVNIDIDQLHTAQHRPFQVNSAELSVAQVDSAKPRSAQVDALESGAVKIGTKEVSHTTTLSRAVDVISRGGLGLTLAAAA